MRGGSTSQDFEAQTAAFIFYSLLNWEPMEFCQEWSTGLRARGLTNKSGSRILNTLQRLKNIGRTTDQSGVAIV